MARDRFIGQALTAVTMFTAFSCAGQVVLANGFLFDDGTAQGWTLQGAYDPGTGGGPYSSNFTNGWSDSVNYPRPPGSDPIGDACGSLEMYTQGDHGIDQCTGEWWLMQLHSPDLSWSDLWQKASGYSVRIAECMGKGKTTLYANLFVKVYDFDQKRDRYFTNGIAVPLIPNSWSYHSQDWSGEIDFPTDYVVRDIFVDIWGLMQEGHHLNGGIYLDEVLPVFAAPDIYVDDDGGGPQEDGSRERPFDQIQEAIDAADDGQTVVLLDGTYTGNGNRDIEFRGKAITLRSEKGPENCIIDCQGTAQESHRGFIFNSGEDADSVVKGVTITSGYAHQGGAILCIDSSPAILNCIISKNQASGDGGGIGCDGSSMTIINCVIVYNKASAGGGIHSNDSSPTVDRCTISENDADDGGGICCNNSSAEIGNSILWGNTAGLSGPQIVLKGTSRPSTLTVSYSDVAGGLAGAYVEAGCTLNWGVGNIDADPILTPDKYHLPSHSSCVDAGQLTVDYTDQIDIDYAPRVFNGRVDIGADEFSPQIYNVAQDIYHDTIQAAIDMALDGDLIIVPDGIYTGIGNRDVNFKGKAITLRSENGPGRCVIDCHGTQEKFHRGFNFNNYEDANSVLTGFTIMNGYHIQSGGIWCIYANPTIMNCRFCRNTATDGGGGLYCSDSSPTISNCTFTANTAAWGGGICGKQSSPKISNCTFNRNTADWGGSLYCAAGGDPIIVNCILWGNIARKNGMELALRGGHDVSTLTVSYSNVAGGSAAVYTSSGWVVDWGPGNIDANPLLTPDGHLRTGSPCIDVGAAAGIPAFDRDNESRADSNASDIGSDEFIDADGDRLPDSWEHEHFGSSTAANPADDPDGDGLTNQQEYELYSSDPNASPYYVDTSIGNDSYNGLAAAHQSGSIGPKKTIQAGMDVARDGDTVLVAAGTYTGPGNTLIDFAGKSVVLHAPEGPASTTIDCEHFWSCAFHFHSNETPGSAVVGFKSTNVLRKQGRAIVCWNSHPQIRNCEITSNADNKWGGALYCYSSLPILADCHISGEDRDGVWFEYGGAEIIGTVQMASVDCKGTDLALLGAGTLEILSDVTLDLRDCRICCNIKGPGTILVGFGSELIVEADAVIDLGHETLPSGRIVCDGLLRLKDNASVIDGELHVSRAIFEDNAIILNCVVNAEAGAPYGQFFVQDDVHIGFDKIKSDGDRYLDLDPTEFDCNNISVGAIEVDITEGVGAAYGGLFELRGRDIEARPCDPDEFLCQLDSVPEFDPNTWTIDKLELVPGAKLNLTNRFDFQAPYDAGGDYEVLYVKQLILGPDSVLNLAFNRLYYETLTIHPTAQIINVPLLGFSLHNISLDDENDYLTRVKNNNFEHPENSGFDRVHVERVQRLEPDPNGMMRMRNLADLDPESPTYGKAVNARAKGLFAKSSEAEILIRFEYLFEGPVESGELVIYLSDAPELLGHCDSLRSLCYIEVARVKHPAQGRPGSVGSGRFGTFERTVPTGHLNFTRGTRIEFELVGPEQTCVLINDWDPAVLRCTMKCGDVAGALHEVNAEDFLAVIGECGRSTGESAGTASGDLSCVDGFFCADGFVTADDAAAIDLISPPSPLTNLCPGNGILSGGTPVASTSFKKAGLLGLRENAAAIAANQTEFKGELLVVGKAYKPGYPWGDFLSDCLYGLNEQGSPVCGSLAMQNNRANSKLVRDHLGQLYQINLEIGLIRISDSDTVVVPPGTCTGVQEPRYGQLATVYVGLQDKGGKWVPPILDAAFDAGGYLYVAPVVVAVAGQNCYSAAAKLELLSTHSPPYEVVQLFHDSSAQIDEECQSNLREIEVDEDGYLYVTNVRRFNESDVLWVWDTNTGELKNRFFLNNPNDDVRVPAPVGMHVSNAKDMLYLGSSLNQPDAASTLVYAISTKDLIQSPQALSSARSIEVHGMGHLTDITEDPTTGILWAVGFSIPEVPVWPQYYYMPEQSWLSKEPFYEPRLAKITGNNWESQGTVYAEHLSDYSDPSFSLALPLSLVWIGTRIDFVDFAALAEYWRDSGCLASGACDGADLDGNGAVDMADFAVLADYWLQGHSALPGPN